MGRIGNVDYQPRSHKFRIKREGEETFRVTVDGMPEKSWTGGTEEQAVWAAKKGVDKIYQAREQTQIPKWMEAEMARSKARADAAEADFAGLTGGIDE